MLITIYITHYYLERNFTIALLGFTVFLLVLEIPQFIQSMIHLIKGEQVYNDMLNILEISAYCVYIYRHTKLL